MPYEWSQLYCVARQGVKVLMRGGVSSFICHRGQKDEEGEPLSLTLTTTFDKGYRANSPNPSRAGSAVPPPTGSALMQHPGEVQGPFSRVLQLWDWVSFPACKGARAEGLFPSPHHHLLDKRGGTSSPTLLPSVPTHPHPCNSSVSSVMLLRQGAGIHFSSAESVGIGPAFQCCSQ